MPIDPMEEWRQPSVWERSILDRLLEADFPGRDELRAQVDGCEVRIYDADGCLEIRTSVDVAAPVEKPVPVKGWTKDEDGMPVKVMLFVWDGFIAELEFNRVDGGSPINLPSPSEWEL
jgi:hypothetical protein